jgi:hypothetical protein
VIGVLDHQHPEDHLDGRAMPTLGQTLGIAPAEIALDPLEDHIIVQQAVEFLQLGLEGGIALGDEGKEVDRLIAIHDHDDKASGEGMDGMTTPSYAPDVPFLAILRQKLVREVRLEVLQKVLVRGCGAEVRRGHQSHQRPQRMIVTPRPASERSCTRGRFFAQWMRRWMLAPVVALSRTSTTP